MAKPAVELLSRLEIFFLSECLIRSLPVGAPEGGQTEYPANAMIAPLEKSDGKPLKRIRDISRDVYIVAYKENTQLLEDFFLSRGFEVRVLRRTYSPEEQALPATVRGMLNHCDAWQAIADCGRPGIVVEADFVPIRRFDEAAAPFDPDLSPIAVGWLYAGGPVIYGFDKRGFAIGHSSTAVALLVMPGAAPAMVAFANKEMASYGPKNLLWDTYFCHHLRGLLNVPTYIPFKQLGEHGGFPNQQHKDNMIRIWHQGDILLDRLAFIPMYARGSKLRYRAIRARAGLRGVLRLLTGRFIELPAFRGSRQKRLILLFTLSRWLPWTQEFAGFDAWR